MVNVNNGYVSDKAILRKSQTDRLACATTYFTKSRNRNLSRTDVKNIYIHTREEIFGGIQE